MQQHSPQYYSSQSLTPIPQVYAKQYRSPSNNEQYQKK